MDPQDRAKTPSSDQKSKRVSLKQALLSSSHSMSSSHSWKLLNVAHKSSSVNTDSVLAHEEKVCGRCDDYGKQIDEAEVEIKHLEKELASQRAWRERKNKKV